MNIALALAAAYLLGSIPSAVWFSRWIGKIDIREHGSKNAGLTNTIRVLGWKAAAPVAVIDLARCCDRMQASGYAVALRILCLSRMPTDGNELASCGCRLQSDDDGIGEGRGETGGDYRRFQLPGLCAQHEVRNRYGCDGHQVV